MATHLPSLCRQSSAALHAAEERQALDLWSELVRSLIEGTEAKVVPLRSRDPAA